MIQFCLFRFFSLLKTFVQKKIRLKTNFLAIWSKVFIVLIFFFYVKRKTKIEEMLL